MILTKGVIQLSLICNDTIEGDMALDFVVGLRRVATFRRLQIAQPLVFFRLRGRNAEFGQR